jgi:hypothetical protein
MLIFHLLADAPLIELASNIYNLAGRATPLLFTLLPMTVALIMWFALKKFGFDQFKWLAMIPLLAGLVVGVLGFVLLNDPLYVQFNMTGSRGQIIYRAVAIVPILTAIGLFLHDRFTGRMMDSSL